MRRSIIVYPWLGNLCALDIAILLAGMHYAALWSSWYLKHFSSLSQRSSLFHVSHISDRIITFHLKHIVMHRSTRPSFHLHHVSDTGMNDRNEKGKASRGGV